MKISTNVSDLGSATSSHLATRTFSRCADLQIDELPNLNFLNTLNDRMQAAIQLLLLEQPHSLAQALDSIEFSARRQKVLLEQLVALSNLENQSTNKKFHFRVA